MLTKPTTRNGKGFTLIELMIVIAIIGILAAIAIPQFSAYRIRSYNALAEGDLRNAATSQEAYYSDNHSYASDAGNLIGSYISKGVNLEVSAVSNSGYTMTAYHTSGDKTYSLSGPGGTMESN